MDIFFGLVVVLDLVILRVSERLIDILVKVAHQYGGSSREC